jgi:hypothetical protein
MQVVANGLVGISIALDTLAQAGRRDDNIAELGSRQPADLTPEP